MLTKFCVSAFCLALVVPSLLRAADNKTTTPADTKQSAQAAPASPAGNTSDDTKAKGRLPSGWGKLGITDTQKQAVYKLESSYEAKIEALHKQLSDLEAQRDADMRNVLTDAQRKQLDDAASTKSTKKAAATDSKSVAPAAAAPANKT